jgi:ATP-dependent DNA helicase RecG
MRSARDDPRRDGARDAPGLARTGIAQLHGVGPRVAERLAAIGVATVQDLLFHLPLRYQDRTRIAPIASVRAGQELLVCGEIRSARVNLGRRRSLLAVIADASGALTIRFFHFSAAQEAALKPGLPMRCFGEVRRGPSGLEMVHPEYRVGEPGVAPELDDRLTPVYASTEGVGQNTWRRLTDQALVLLERGAVEELLPRAVLQRFDFPSLDVALASVHRPSPEVSLQRLNNDGHPGVRRLAF